MLTTYKLSKLTEEISDNTVKVVFNEKGVTSTYSDGTAVRSWESIKELILIKDYMLFIQKGSFQYFIVPRIEKEIEDFSINMISRVGGKASTEADKQYRKHILIRSCVLIIVIFLIAILVKIYF
jgi:histone deacetylase complex regulatory component SIN3